MSLFLGSHALLQETYSNKIKIKKTGNLCFYQIKRQPYFQEASAHLNERKELTKKMTSA